MEYPPETLLSCSPEAVDVFHRLNGDAVLEQLKSAYVAAVTIDEAVKDCVHFEFLRHEKIEDLIARDEQAGTWLFWIQVAQLLLFITRSVPRAINRLVEGIVDA